MNIKSHHQAQFNHEEWIEYLFRFVETVQEFLRKVFQNIKTLSQKGLVKAWKEIRTAASKLNTLDIIFMGLTVLAGLLGGLIFLIGLGLLGYQLVLWLLDGVWTSLPLYVVFDFIFENTAFQQWMAHPESWFGMQKLFSGFLETTPLSLALMVPGILIAVAWAGVLSATLVIRFYQIKNHND